ncbi:LOW QUALITY PROTEIN: ataxin-2 homolog [Durio zibethinus]|uniref:LOW QUALITY PROTEIN: ataxin-2 homolog n=1 Tax=Durio zibethinus TaxID=66656 RepID=A0A6P5X5Z0_DURZI|nr:LOW QUALITY PROTEIN: ataxin-2 homolog [Durio zibethinus]
MGVSFKVSKTGTRFKPKPCLQSEATVDVPSDDSKESSRPRKLQGDVIQGVERVLRLSQSIVADEAFCVPADHEISFTLNLYPDGYSIGKPQEKEALHQATFQDASKLHPYDRSSETLFSAIESGRLPGDILDDILCKYVDGTLVCEVRDYRKVAPQQGSNIPAMDGSPITNKVRLRMSLENVVKDIPLISDNSWTYGDLMEAESRILKALQPQLYLDPTPKLDRLCTNPVPTKLNLASCSLRRKRLRQAPEVTVTSTRKIHGKKVCIDRVPECSNGRLEEAGIVSGNLMPQQAQENLTPQNIGPSNMLALRPKSFVPDSSVPALPMTSPSPRYQMGVLNARSMQDHGSSSVVNAAASAAGQDMTMPYAESINSGSSLLAKRENPDGPMSPLSGLNKRTRLNAVGPDGMPQQQVVPHMDGLNGPDISWKNMLLPQQAMARGIQYANPGMQKYPQQVFEGVLNQEAGAMPFAAAQQALRYGAKEEPFDPDKLDGSQLNRETDTKHLDPQQTRLQPRLPHGFVRPGFPQTPWNNISQHVEKEARKEDQFQKRKSVQSPRLSSGALPQSPLSSKSGEFSSGSVGPHFGAVATTSALGASLKEKAAVNSVPAVGGTPSLTSSANDSMQQQHQAQVAAKLRSNSLPKTPAINAVGSPVSVSNISVPFNASSPSVGTPPLADQTMLERFSKIETVTMRYQLNSKKSKGEEYHIQKPSTHSPQLLSACLTSLSSNEDFKNDLYPLSKSLFGGSMNTYKTRILNFVQGDHVVQGNVVSLVSRVQTRMIMSEKPTDGTVAMIYGDIDDGDILGVEDHIPHLPTLPNTHLADLLAQQFCSLMQHEGHHLVKDNVQAKPTRVLMASSSQPISAVAFPNNSAADMQHTMQQYAEAAPCQATNEVAKPNSSNNISINPSPSVLGNTRTPPPGNPQALQMSQGLLSGVSMPTRPPQLDPQPPLQPQPQPQQAQQQQPQQLPPAPQQQQSQQHILLQQQHQQFPRSPMMLASNPLPQLNAIGQNSNVQLGNQMISKPSPLQLQMIKQQQQQQQPQQQAQMSRKMMMGLGTAVGMGNMSTNMVRLGGLGNAMGIGGARGIGGTGISAPMTPISGVGNMGQNSISSNPASSITNAISQQLRSGTLTQAQAALISKLRMGGGSLLGGPQSSIAGMSGARQMHPGSATISMLGQNLNQANMNSMQRTAMGPMGPPKMMPGMNHLYMNHHHQQQQQQQQQLQLQHQQHQQHQQQLQQQHQLQQLQQQLQQQQQPQQQQETTSPLQAVVSSSQVGSPSTMGIPQVNQQPLQQQAQQQTSPQQMNQRTPMSPQLSSGAIHALSAGNPEACPASPQLSSQTLGSVSSITNSPMELGVNKSNSVGNT